MRRAMTTHAGRERSERGAQVVDRQPAMAAVHDVEGAAEERSDRQHTAHRQSPHDPNNGDGMLDSLANGKTLVRQ